MAATESLVPEYLISQLMNTCLTVLSGTDAHDAVIGLAHCDGNINQRWYVVDGRWQWAGNQALCLSKDNASGELCLRSCDSARDSWVLDGNGRFVLGNEALTAKRRNQPIQLCLLAKTPHLNQKWWTFSELKTSLNPGRDQSFPEALLDMCRKELERLATERGLRSLKLSTDDVCQASGDSCGEEFAIIDPKSARPDYIINRSTLTFLTVMNENGPIDADIALTPFTGNLNQQWIADDKHWLWAGDPSYSLTANMQKGSVRLAASQKPTNWNFNRFGFLKTRGKALQAPQAESAGQVRVNLGQKSDGNNQKWWKLSDVMMALKSTPTEHKYPEALVKMIKEEPLLDEDGWTACHDETNAIAPSPEDSYPLVEEPEYLVNQSTLTCLTALDSSAAEGAVIGLAPYAGTKNQQWCVEDGHWQLGSSDNLFLGLDSNVENVRLVSETDLNTTWCLTQEGSFMNGSLALDVSKEDSANRVILQPELGDVGQKWWTLSSVKALVKEKLYPFPARDMETYKQEIARGIVNNLSPLSEPLPYPRDVSHYPGHVAASMLRTNFTCVLNVANVKQPKNIRMRFPLDWQATKMYVVPGEIFTLTLPDTLSDDQAAQIRIKVGAHTDVLKPALPKVRKLGYKRMPVISQDFTVKPGINRYRSQYGGNLIFIYDGKKNFTVTAEVQNVVETPHYVLGETNEEEWKRMRELDTPFSVLESRRVVVVVRTSRAVRLQNPETLLHRYDDIIEKIEDLAGFTEDDSPPQGKMWLVDDVQISAGCAHAGFPVMFQHQLNDLASPSTPYSWVVWHEIGHNYQQRQFWSQAYGIESTVNLFSLYIQEKLKSNDRLKNQNTYKSTAKAVNKGLAFANASVWQKLVFLMEIKHAFPEHGWDIYRHINRVTRALTQDEAKSFKGNLQRQYDHFYSTLSKFIGTDLLPHFQRWQIPISQEAQKELDSLGLPKCNENLSTSCCSD